MRFAFVALFAMVSSPVLAAPQIPPVEISRNAIDGYIRPEFHLFAEQTEELRVKTAILCARPSTEALSAVRNRFASSVIGFSRIEFVRVGPLSIADRMERLLFWPDRKGIALKQVQAALAEQDETATAPDTLQVKSVAMQGLVALEYLLFGTGSETLATPGGNYRCRYAAASTTLIAGLAATLDTEWADPNGQSLHMLAPQPTYDDFRTETEVLEKLAATLIHGTEVIRDQRINPILGLNDGGPKPKSALFWRSNLTAATLAANFAGLHDYFVAAHFTEALSARNHWIADSAIYEFENAAEEAAKIVDPIEFAVTDLEQLRALRYLVVVTGSLDTILGENLGAALGLTVGFSQLDGD